MFSAFLIALVWWTYTTLFCSSKLIAEVLALPIGFVATLSSLYLFYFASIQFLSTRQFIAVAIFAVFGMLGFLVSRPLAALQTSRILGQFLGLIELNGQPVEGTLAVSLKWLSRGMAISRKLLTVLVIVSLVITALFQAFPANWDSNVYNLARLPAMIHSGSPFLPETGSIRQAAMPLGHDLLYFPDIAIANLRGMGLIGCLEYVALLGGLLQLADICLTELPLRHGNQAMARQMSFLLTTCLLFSSDQQRLQALSTKNDLIIVVLFVFALVISLRHIMMPGLLGYPEFFSIVMLLVAYSLSCKSYGVVVLLPPLVCTAAAQLHAFTAGNQLSRRPSHFFQVLQNWFIDFVAGLTPLYCFFLVASVAVLVVYFCHQSFVLSHYKGSSLEAVTTFWTNTHGSMGLRLQIMLLNLCRIVVSFFAYPYSTWLKYRPLRDDDYLFGLGPFAPFLNQSGLGVPAGFSFTLSRNSGEDHALTSPLFHFVLLVVLASMLIRYLWRVGRGMAFPVIRSPEIKILQPSWLISISSVASMVLIFAAILYQNWIFRFVGTGYVPLMPVIATAFTGLCMPTAAERFRPKYSVWFIFASSFLAYVCAFYSFLGEVTFYPSGLVDSYRRWNSSPTEFTLRQNPRTFYYDYLAGHGLTRTDVDRLLGLIRSSSFKRETICFREDTPTLVPLLAVISDQKVGGRIDLRSINSDRCMLTEGEWKPGVSRHAWQRQNASREVEQLVILP
jgi:hypothetical protein